MARNMTQSKRESVWTKNQPKARVDKVLRVLPQTGKIKSIARDAARKAKAPGLRISKTGKKYWESRKSRSDVPGTRL